MKLSNQNNTFLILLLHSFLIATGMIVAYFIPSTEDPTTIVKLPLDSLLSDNHSHDELLSWLNFLDLPHEETLFGKDTLCEVLDKYEKLGALSFFTDVAAGDHVDYLADRISASAMRDVPYHWRITLHGASLEEASSLFKTLHIVQQQKFSEQLASYDPPIEIEPPEFGGVDSISPSFDRLFFGKACPPAVGALLAVTLVVVAWSLCMPGQRKLSMASSVSLLLASTLVLSFVGAGAGYLFTTISGGEWESEMAVHVRCNLLRPLEDLAPETQSLTAILKQKVSGNNFFYNLNKKSIIKQLVDKKGMTNWRSFRQILKARGNETDEGVAVDPDLLCDYIIDRLESEQDSDIGNVYFLRFRSEDKHVTRVFLECLFTDYSARDDAYIEQVGIGGPLTHKREINRLSNPKCKKAGWSPVASWHTFQGAFIGAIFALVIVSSTRVLSGAPTI